MRQNFERQLTVTTVAMKLMEILYNVRRFGNSQYLYKWKGIPPVVVNGRRELGRPAHHNFSLPGRNRCRILGRRDQRETLRMEGG